MPEGPQVYRMAERLRETLNGAVMNSLILHEIDSEASDEEGNAPLITKSRRAVQSELHSKVRQVITKGKRAVIVLDDGTGVLITFALTGKLEYFLGSSPDMTSATISVMGFSIGKQVISIALMDPQHLASVTLDKLATIVDTMLPSGFDPLHTVEGMREWLATCKSHPGQLVANFITNQSIVAGVGNRYRSEVMHVAKVPPDSRVKDLSGEQLQLLLIAIYRVLKLASRGEYVFTVYGRKDSFPEGEPVTRSEVAKGILVYTTARTTISARRVLRRTEDQ